MDDEQDLENQEQEMESFPTDMLEDNSEENVSMELEPPEKPVNAIGSKKLINLLLKKKILMIGIVVACAFILLIIIVAIFSEETELNSYRYKENATCDNVTITYAPFGSDDTSTQTMPLEQYVEGTIEAYTSSLKNIPEDLFNYYYALAVAIRTEAISNGCQVTYHDKTISETSTNNSSLHRAMNLSKGIILTDKEDNLVNVKVSDFCWKEKKDNLDYILYQGADLIVPYNSVNTYLNNDVYETCSCNNSENISKPSDADDGTYDICWEPIYEEEDEDNDGLDIIDYEWKHQDDEEGYSILGSFYVYLETGKNYLDLLKYFFGDVTLMTTVKPEPIDSTLAFQNGNLSSSCNTSSAGANLVTFLEGWEGNEGFCDNGNGYLAKNIGDGTVTVGMGVTNYDFGSSSTKAFIDQNNWGQYFHVKDGAYRVESGDCVPVSVIDQIEIHSLDANYAYPIDGIAQKYNVTLTQYQKDALTSFNYNLGSEHTEKLISAYASGGLEGLWNVMKQYVNATINGVYGPKDGLKKRRKGEFALFVTGDYTDMGQFYGRGLNNYDDYNSEGVVGRAAKCNMSSNSDFLVPLPLNSNFACTSPFGYREPPTSTASSFHQALDLGVAGGTDIYATKSGTVVETLNTVIGKERPTGNYVKIQHDDGTGSAYYHMKTGSVTVNVGDKVTQGQKIGEVGTTGDSTGNHLHFIVYDVTGTPVDPYDYIDLSFMQDTSDCQSIY